MPFSDAYKKFCFECRNALTRLRREESGGTAIMAALAMTVLVGMVGLGTEVGLWYAERRAMQSASDAAVMGAAFAIYDAKKDGEESSAFEEAGLTDSARNGFTHGSENVAVEVNNPPTTGKFAGKKTAVETIVTKQRATLLGSFFMGDSVNIKVRSVATVKYVGVYCILALAPHEEGALLFTGTADVQLKNCGVNVNSDDASGALTAKGASVVGATYADVVGGISQSNNTTLDFGEINTGADAVDDPYAHLDVPPGSGCDYTNFKVGPSENKTLSPGRYCNGILIQGTAHFQAGNYIIVGGVFDVRATAVVTTADEGITIFLTGSSSNYAQVTINGGANITIKAATQGDYMGIAFFQDRNAPIINSGSPNKFNGGSTMNIIGAIYIPNQLTTFTGGNTTNGTCTRIVAYMVSFSGTSGLNTDCSYGFGESNIFPPVLVE